MTPRNFNLHCEIQLLKHALIQISFVAYTSKTTIPASGLIAEVSTFIFNCFDLINIIHTVSLTHTKQKETPKLQTVIHYDDTNEITAHIIHPNGLVSMAHDSDLKSETLRKKPNQ